LQGKRRRRPSSHWAVNGSIYSGAKHLLNRVLDIDIDMDKDMDMDMGFT
jgi:hypothetical protein